MSEKKEYTQDELLRLIVKNTHETAQHTKRTAKNVAFFFWLWLIGVILLLMTLPILYTNSLMKSIPSFP